MFQRKIPSGMTMIELMLGIMIIAILLRLAVPTYIEFLAKRRTAGAVETLTSYIEDAKMEAIKRNRPVTVRFRNTYDGNKWCFGKVVGTTACDCVITDPSDSAYCDIVGADT